MKSEIGDIKCDPVVFVDDSLSLLRDINSYSLLDMKDFVKGLSDLLDGNKVWNGDDYDFHWSGGELAKFVSNEKSTEAIDVFSGESIELSTIGIYEMLLDRLRLMENYPKRLIRKIILEPFIFKSCKAGLSKRVEFVNVPQFFIEENAEAIKFDSKYYS